MPDPAPPTGENGVLNVLDFGAKGDGKTIDTRAVQKAIDACAAMGGGQVLLPAGKTFLSGALTLRSGVDLHVANGATLKGSADWRDYLPSGSLLFAKDAANISLTGSGTIDGNDSALWQKLADEEAGGDLNKDGWWPESFIGDWWPFGKKPGEPDKGGGRPMMVIFIHCDNVRLHEITLRRPKLDSPSRRLPQRRRFRHQHSQFLGGGQQRRHRHRPLPRRSHRQFPFRLRR